MGTHAKPVITYEIYIGAPAEKVWKGLVDPDLTQQYVYGTRFDGKLQAGSPYAYLADGSFGVVDGKILDVQPASRLAMTWCAHWDEASGHDRPSRVTYELSPAGPDTTKLRVVHDDFDSETATYKGSVEGWPLMMSSLKSLLESGKPLAINQSESGNS
jgi:uncharacterized protein YndB with AHSA1/START domain